MQLLELFEVQHAEGPCLDSYRTGTAISCDDLEADGALAGVHSRGPLAVSLSVYAPPMRLRDQVIGSLNLLRDEHPHGLDAADLVAAQALADVVIGILHWPLV